MTNDATLSAALRALSGDIAESGDSETCALLERAAKRIDEQHAEILRLRMFAPGQHPEHNIRMAPHIASTNFAFYGIKEDES